MSLFAGVEECEAHGGNQQQKCHEVVPVQLFALEEDGHENGEYREGDHLLNDFQLNQREWTAVFGETNYPTSEALPFRNRNFWVLLWLYMYTNFVFSWIVLNFVISNNSVI